jgi:hypothetical protein
MMARVDRLADEVLAALDASLRAEHRAERYAKHLLAMERYAGWLVSYEYLADVERRLIAAECAAVAHYEHYVALASEWYALLSFVPAADRASIGTAVNAYVAGLAAEHVSGETPSRRAL